MGAACGGSDTAVPQGQSAPDDARASAPPSASRAPSATGELVLTERTLPAEPAYGFADIATTVEGADRAWSRFRLPGSPPPHDERAALLFRGVGESGSCPVQFSGLEITDHEVRLTTPDAGVSASRACTADYSPRTLVIAVPVDALPQGLFMLDGFVLATSDQAAPSGPSTVDPWIGGDLGIEVRSEPAAVVAGDQVQVVVSSGRYSAMPGSWTTELDRWQGQLWLPAAGSSPHGDHPAATPAREQIAAGGSGPIASVDTTGLPPGRYRVRARLGLGDSEGSTGVQAFLTVKG